MTIAFRPICCWLLVLLAGFTSAADAAERDGDKWTSLFDGTSLEGWQRHSGAATFNVEDGAIVGTSVPNTGNTFLCTENEYGDFVFECEFKVDKGLNSGVQFRSEYFEDDREIDLGDGETKRVPADRVHGYQCEIDCADKPDRMWTGGIYDEARRGWLFPGPLGGDKDEFTAQGVRTINPEGWNTFRIECRGNAIKTYVNGELRASFEDDLTPRGVIALQVHGVGNNPDRVGKQARWKNLRIRELAAE